MGDRRVVFGLGLFVILVSTLGVNHVFAQDPGYSIYENSDMGLRVEYPTGTFIDDSVFGIVFFYAPLDDENDNFNENIVITTENLPEPLTLDEYVDLTIENFELAGFSVTESKSTTLDKNRAKEITISMELEGQKIDQTQIVAIKDQTVYLMALTTLPQTTLRYMPTFERMVDSFEFSEIIETPIELEEFPISQFLVYENTAQGITMKYPPNWQKVEPEGTPGIDVILQSPLESVSDGFAENSVLAIQKSPGMSFGDYTQVAINNFESRPTGIIIDEESPTILGGLPAHQIIYTETSEFGIEVKSWMVWTLANDSVYTVGFGSEPKSFDSYESTFQKILDSVEIEEIDLPTPISGTYSNSKVGLEMQFPEGWEGIKMKQENVSIAFATTGISTKLFSSEVDPNFSMIMIMIGSFEDIKELGAKPECSVPPTGTIIKFGEAKTIEIVGKCMEPTSGVELKMLTYTFATNEDMILVVYTSGSDQVYDRDLSQFEESLKTLRLSDTIDISNYENYAKIFDYNLNKETITIDSQVDEIAIVGNVTIAEFSFSENYKEISFRPTDNIGTGFTEIFVSKALKGPYTVKIDGITKNDFWITEDTTTGNTIISLDYELPVQEISITANVIESSQIPDWIKNNAEWWAQGAIGDSDFVSGIQFLIKEGIMTIPETAQGTASDDSGEIPSWIKNNADWWAQGLITDDDFVKGIQFLVEQGIISV